MGRAGEARAEFERLVAREPRNANAIYGLARCHMELGKFEQARPWLDKLLEICPSHASAYRDLACSRQLDVDGAHFARATSLLDDATLAVNQRVVVHFALAAAEEAAGHSDEAFGHYRFGNMLKNVIHGQSAHAEVIDRLCAAFDAEFFRRTEGWGDDGARPIFILGMPRSGTTLTEQIVASHPRVFGAGELNDLLLMAARLPETLATDEPFPQCAHRLTRAVVPDLAAAYLDKLARLSSGAERVSDKMPGNFLRIGLIATSFPKARIIHCRREARDTCLSIYFQNFEGHHPYAYDLSNLGHYYRQYERLMDH
jgi:tetratricopeptide (TPR) repeat protein